MSCRVSLVDYVQGNIMAITNKDQNLLAVPIFCLFVFALFIPKAKPLGVWIDHWFALPWQYPSPFRAHRLLAAHTLERTAGNLGVELLANGQSACQDPISFQWIGPVTLIADLTVGTLVSWMISGRRKTAPVSV
ncbi:MAG: hypothetical protein R3C28_25515 [Pirellulaceae bacterium]